MHRPIVSFSASPEEIAAKSVSKNPQLYSTRQFNRDPVELASHRDDRIFRSNQIWVQSLSTDPAFPIIASISNSHALVTQS